jgi:hypothetical protein
LAENAQRFKVEFRKNEIWIELFTEAQAGLISFLNMIPTRKTGI